MAFKKKMLPVVAESNNKKNPIPMNGIYDVPSLLLRFGLVMRSMWYNFVKDSSLELNMLLG